MNKFGKIATVALGVLLGAAAFAGCGGDERKKGKIQISFYFGLGTTEYDTVKAIVDEYNETNTDNIYVNFKRQSAEYSSSIGTLLQGQNPPDIVQLDQVSFKGYAMQKLLSPLDEYITEEEQTVGSGTNFNVTDIYPSVMNRYRVNMETGVSGPGEPIVGVPYYQQPMVIYYNLTQFKAQKVNVISIAESELPAGVLPHGYYVYDTAPTVAGMTFEARADGKYHVFNDQVPMNWEETVELSKIFTKEYNPNSESKYGFFQEWWFSYGWSVGGDCLEWDTYNGKEQYTFQLGNDNAGYLVTGDKNLTIDGEEYEPGDVLKYEAKKYVAAHKDDPTIAGYLAGDEPILYELPSTLDAFTEFVRLSQVTSKAVNNAGDKGYGICPSPTTLSQKGKDLYFTSGEVCMSAEVLSPVKAASYEKNMKILGKEWGVAPAYQYREYNADGTIKKINGTEVKGRQAAHNDTACLSIPKNAKRKAQAAQFIKYFAGKKAQSEMLKGYSAIPVNMSQLEEFENSDSFIPNKKMVMEAAHYCTQGDWSYIEDRMWIVNWSDVLNTSVRDGDMTLEQFFNDPKVLTTNATLSGYKMKSFTGRE